jgi:hypothetical protein
LKKSIKTSYDEIQNVIDPSLNFRYNSVNILIGQRGSGKTHFALKEVLKLGVLPDCGNYSQVYYASNKARDDTFNKFQPLIEKTNLELIQIKHDELGDVIDMLSQTKDILCKEKPNCGSGSVSLPWSNQALNWTDKELPHSIIIIDDCIGLFKDPKIYKYLFENRQTRITYFLSVQDPQAIPPSLKANMDCLVLFGGFSPQKFNVLFYQIALDTDRKILYQKYKMLNKNQYMLVDFDTEEEKIKFGP